MNDSFLKNQLFLKLDSVYMISTIFSWAGLLFVIILYFSKFVIEWNLLVTDRYTVYPAIQLDIEMPKKGNV